MTTFHQALNTLLADLTPQPWKYTSPAGATLTVIPAGLREDHGRAEVLIRITTADATGLAEFGITTDRTRGAAEVGITTADLPALITALTDRTALEHGTATGAVAVHPDAMGVAVAVTEDHYPDGVRRVESVALHLPEEQRMPLASALRRAYDVAQGWEDKPQCAECPQRVEQGVTYCSNRCRNAADSHDNPAGDSDE